MSPTTQVHTHAKIHSTTAVVGEWAWVVSLFSFSFFKDILYHTERIRIEQKDSRLSIFIEFNIKSFQIHFLLENKQEDLSYNITVANLFISLLNLKLFRSKMLLLLQTFYLLSRHSFNQYKREHSTVEDNTHYELWIGTTEQSEKLKNLNLVTFHLFFYRK